MPNFHKKYKLFAFAGVCLVGGFFAVNFALPGPLGAIEFKREGKLPDQNVVETKPEISHINTPYPLRSLYMTSCIASSKKMRESLVDLIDKTSLNALVVDVKDYSGFISFLPKDKTLLPATKGGCFVSDMADFVKYLHSKNIYTIARVTVFQDPFFAPLNPHLAVLTKDGSVWKDRKGISFLEPASKEVHDRTILIAKEAYELGFDEINFDYIRFPSDGNMKDIYFPITKESSKADTIEKFFEYLNRQMTEARIPISADLFGMTTSAKNDMGIGQVLERAMPYFDFIAPMVYPSHYPTGAFGYKNPNDYPYEIVKRAMDDAVLRFESATTTQFGFLNQMIGTSTPAIYEKTVFDRKKLRTWIQDFDYGGEYSKADVLAQIKASIDAGVESFMVWDPSNKYTKEAYYELPL